MSIEKFINAIVEKESLEAAKEYVCELQTYLEILEEYGDAEEASHAEALLAEVNQIQKGLNGE